ncbi:VOC family protein [Acidobacteriota bacterium]
MFQINKLDHINIIVDDIDEALNFYQNLLGAEKIHIFPHFKNVGFAQSAGFLNNPDKVDVTMAYLKIPNTETRIELFCFHNPEGNTTIQYIKTNDLGGTRHVCLQVDDIHAAFKFIKGCEGVTLINQSPEYKPHKIDKITTSQFKYFDAALENDAKKKQDIADLVAETSFFYFIDRYGVQWEFESAPSVP